MRFLLAGLVLLMSLAPAEAKVRGAKATCNGNCDSGYKFCMAHAPNSKVKAQCKQGHKSCKRGC